MTKPIDTKDVTAAIRGVGEGLRTLIGHLRTLDPSSPELFAHSADLGGLLVASLANLPVPPGFDEEFVLRQIKRGFEIAKEARPSTQQPS